MEPLCVRLTLPWLRDLGGDLRYASRTLRKSPSFATVAVLTLALGIGPTTAIYSVVDTILLQPLPFTDSDRLMGLFENRPTGRGGATQRPVPYALFLE